MPWYIVALESILFVVVGVGIIRTTLDLFGWAHWHWTGECHCEHITNQF